jgi:hypothetical protein
MEKNDATLTPLDVLEALRGHTLVLQVSIPYVNEQARAIYPFTNYRGTIPDGDDAMVEIGDTCFLHLDAVDEKGERVPLLINIGTIQWIEIADGPRIAVPTIGKPTNLKVVT